MADDRTSNVRKPKALRRSARLGPKGTWKFKDDSSSEAEYDDDTSRVHPRRNGTTKPTASKYATRSVQNHTIRRQSSGMSSRHFRAVQIPKASMAPSSSSLSLRKAKRTLSRSLEIEEDGYLYYDDDGGKYRSSHKEESSRIVDTVDGSGVWNLGVGVLSQIRNYLPYYSDHIPDARLSAFIELMEKLEGIGSAALSMTPDLRQTTNYENTLSNRDRL